MGVAAAGPRAAPAPRNSFPFAFRQVIADTNPILGNADFLEGRMPPEIVDRFITAIETVDPPAISSEHFWFHAIVEEGV